MEITIVGLGLIGGSFARAIKAKTKHRVLAFEQDSRALEAALSDGAIDAVATKETLLTTDLLIVCLYPLATVSFIEAHLPCCKRGVVLLDTCGVKESVCKAVEGLSVQYGARFVGGHPMAGRELSGYRHSLETLYEGASMILTPTETTDTAALSLIETLCTALGFTAVVQTTPAHHDRMIAYTSQLAHLVSSAYIKSPEALSQRGYSAGSYRDLTRVARLNEQMWSELFLENRQALLLELDIFLENLQDYRQALEDADHQQLLALLKEGRERKEQVG